MILSKGLNNKNKNYIIVSKGIVYILARNLASSILARNLTSYRHSLCFPEYRHLPQIKLLLPFFPTNRSVPAIVYTRQINPFAT